MFTVSFTQILDAPFNQQWNVDLYGSINLTLVLRIEGQSVKLSLNGEESIGYASVGGKLKAIHVIIFTNTPPPPLLLSPQPLSSNLLSYSSAMDW